MTGEQALAIMRASMVRDRDRHFRWLVIDTLLMLVLGVGLFFVPGPNVIGYYFAFRVVGHYLSRKGAKQGLDVVTWTTAPCDPLIELRDALASGAAAARRAHRRNWRSACGSRGWRCSSIASAGRGRSPSRGRPAAPD